MVGAQSSSSQAEVPEFLKPHVGRSFDIIDIMGQRAAQGLQGAQPTTLDGTQSQLVAPTQATTTQVQQQPTLMDFVRQGRDGAISDSGAAFGSSQYMQQQADAQALPQTSLPATADYAQSLPLQDEIAGFTPVQQAAFQALSDASIPPELQTGVTQGLTQGIDISRFQNPYQEQVIDSAMQSIADQQADAQNAARVKSLGGGFGQSGRSALLEAQAIESGQRAMADTEASLLSQGFQTAAGLGLQEAQQRLGAEELIRDAQQQQMQLGLTGGQQLLDIGTQQQQQLQNELLQQMSLQDIFNLYQQAVGNAPFGSTSSSSGFQMSL